MAVIEGVMMRGKKAMAIAVRRPDDSISVQEQEVRPWSEYWKGWKLPFIRGTAALIDSMVTGMKALSYSANESAAAEGEELTKTQMVITITIACVFAILLFMVLPTVAVHFSRRYTHSTFIPNLLEGVLRVTIFFLYIWAVSRMKDIQRVFAYHGAEHKTINAFEAGDELEVENVRKYTCLNPRCGTTFLFLVMIVSILLFSFLGWPSFWWRIFSRVALMPVVAGVAYEVMKWSAASCDNKWVRPFLIPGMLLQKFTTREPDDAQIEVAIRALQRVLAVEEQGAVPT